jgi:hypothetical protein
MLGTHRGGPIQGWHTYHQKVNLASVALICFFPFIPLFILQSLYDVPLISFAAGATTGLNCSLCQAGTYGTGSGQDTWAQEILKEIKESPSADTNSVLIPTFAFSTITTPIIGDLVQALINFSAGATAGLSCSLCEAGTYRTGSGQDARTRTPVFSSRKTVLLSQQLSGFSYFLFCLGYFKIYSPSSGWTVRSQDLALTIFAAGATAGISCSLCEAGTYWTGSGQDTLTE